jgi:hypothetical protein
VALVDAIEYKLAKDDSREAKARADHAAHKLVVESAISASRQACGQGSR